MGAVFPSLPDAIICRDSGGEYAATVQSWSPDSSANTVYSGTVVSLTFTPSGDYDSGGSGTSCENASLSDIAAAGDTKNFGYATTTEIIVVNNSLVAEAAILIGLWLVVAVLIGWLSYKLST